MAPSKKKITSKLEGIQVPTCSAMVSMVLANQPVASTSHGAKMKSCARAGVFEGNLPTF